MKWWKHCLVTFLLYIKYNRDLSFISAGFLGEVGLSF